MPPYIALLSEQTERSSLRPQFQYGILELEQMQFRVLKVPVRFVKGSPCVIGHRLSAPTRRLPVGVCVPSHRAPVWFMSGVRPDLAQLYPTRLYSTAIWHYRHSVQIRYRPLMAMSAKTWRRRRPSPSYNRFNPEHGDQHPTRETSPTVGTVSSDRTPRPTPKEREKSAPCAPRLSVPAHCWIFAQPWRSDEWNYQLVSSPQ